MEEDDDAEDIRRVATEYVARWGVERAVEYFLGEALLASSRHDELSADTWREIAQAAREMGEDGWSP